MADDKRRHPYYQNDLFERSFPIVYREGEEQLALGKLTVVLMSSDIDTRLINTAKSHGLGLSIVKRIAHRLGGDVGYERSTDGGSVFWFSLQKAN